MTLRRVQIMLIGRERRTERSIQRRQLNSGFLHQPLTPRLMLLWRIKFLFDIAQISAGSDTQTSVHVEQISLVSHVHGRERRAQIRSDTMYLSISLRESTLPHNRQPNILISKGQQYVDDFVGGLNVFINQIRSAWWRTCEGGSGARSGTSSGGSCRRR